MNKIIEIIVRKCVIIPLRKSISFFFHYYFIIIVEIYFYFFFLKQFFNCIICYLFKIRVAVSHNFLYQDGNELKKRKQLKESEDFFNHCISNNFSDYRHMNFRINEFKRTLTNFMIQFMKYKKW